MNRKLKIKRKDQTRKKKKAAIATRLQSATQHDRSNPKGRGADDYQEGDIDFNFIYGWDL